MGDGVGARDGGVVVASRAGRARVRSLRPRLYNSTALGGLENNHAYTSRTCTFLLPLLQLA